MLKKRAEVRERRWSGKLGARMLNRGRPPDFPVFRPEDPWPGCEDRANALFRGRYDLGCGVVETRSPPWQAEPPSEDWAEALHGFGWVRHFAASPTDAARRHVQALVRSWLHSGQEHPAAWRVPVVARRLFAWAAYAPLILGGGDESYRHGVLRSAQRMAGYLARTASAASPGLPALVAAAGLIHAGLVLPGGGKRYQRGLALLERALEAQILPDGGHASRNPAALAVALAELVALRRALLVAGLPAPAFMVHAIDRIAPMLRFFRHEDGGLAQFNGSSEADEGEIERTLALSDARGRPFEYAPHSAYYRARAGRTLVLFDAGAPPCAPYDEDAHAGCLAFEMSSGRHRLIVNCGEGRTLGPEWRDAARVTAAHSTVAIGSESSCDFREGRLGYGIASGPDHVWSDSHSEAGQTWIEAEHDGYRPRFGVVHRRRLFLADGGGDLRGEDVLKPVSGAEIPPDNMAFARFHLHPTVDASDGDAEQGIRLTLPTGEEWRFRARGGTASLEDSIYFGSGRKARTSQIVIAAPLTPEGVELRWALRRAE